MFILGVRIDNLERSEILQRVRGFLSEPKYHRIATVNPEFLIEGVRNRDFRGTLNRVDLAVADGKGIDWAFSMHDQKLLCRFPGADLAEEILKIAAEKNISVFLAVNALGKSTFAEVKAEVQRRYPALSVEGADLVPDSIDPAALLALLRKGSSSIMLCNFGAPEQESFLETLRDHVELPLRLAMGVGGTFDYWTGKARRAPRLMRHYGIEWLWRLLWQPSRAPRIFRAVVLFPIHIVLESDKK